MSRRRGRHLVARCAGLPVATILGAVLIAFLAVPALTPAVGPGSGSAGGDPHGPSAAVATNATLRGFVFGSTGPGAVLTPIAGVNVTATEPDFHTIAGSVATNRSGGYTLTVPPGSYYVWSNSTPLWGGGGEPDLVNVSAGNTTLNLTAYPYLGYGNATVVLPGWNRMASYMHDGNVMDSQQPVLSWTQDGAFYVNTTDQLVFYSFLNRTVSGIAPWLPLYTNLMDYKGWENQEFITPDGSWVYGLGCLTSCTAATAATLYAVNVTTGRTFEHNWTSEDSTLLSNAQINLVGEDGNLSTAVLIDDTGRTWFYDLWNRTAWEGPILPFFEANNIYWIPELTAYVDVQAEGSTADGIVEWRLAGPGDGTGFDEVFDGHYGSGFLTNAVTGPSFNVSSRALVFDCLSKGAWYTFEYTITPAGVLGTRTILSAQTPGSSTYPDERLTLTVEADEHRASLVEDAPSFSAAFWPFFDNNSFVDNPFGREFYETNQTAGVFANVTYSPDQSGGSSDSADGLYFNGSYLISAESTDCDGGSCPINGAGGLSNGTIWWLWRVGQPEFPSPSDAPIAQTSGPGPVELTGNTTTSNTTTIEWAPATSETDPLLNYSIRWGTSPGAYTGSGSEPAWVRQYTITGLEPGVEVYFAVTAWNLHWHGPNAVGEALLLPGPPVSPTALRELSVTSRSVTVTWTPPPESVLGYTVFWGRSCVRPGTTTIVTPGLRAVISGLAPGSSYCVEVDASDAYGTSPLSTSLSIVTLGKRGGHALPPVRDIPFTPIAVLPSGPTCNFVCFPSIPTPYQVQFWAGPAVAVLGGGLAVQGRRAGGAALLLLGVVLFFL